MIEELKTISLVLAFVFPFIWAITFVITGFAKQRSGFYLFLVMLFASITYLMTYFKFEGHLDVYAILFPIQAGVVLMLFPSFYIYIKSITSDKRLKIKILIIHFIVSMLLFATYLIIQKILIPRESELNFIKYLLDQDIAREEYFALGKSIYNVGKLVFVASAILYVIAIIRLLRRYYKQSIEIFAENEHIDLKWLKGIGLSLIIMTIFFVIIHILKNNQVEPNSLLIAVSYTMFAFFFFYIGLNGFRQKEVYNLTEVETIEEFDPEVKISKEEIEGYLISTKSYIKHDISVFDLCYHFHTNRTYISESIRKGFHTNFKGLINKYRVAEAKEIIGKYVENGFIPEFDKIAAKSGFSTYSTFFRVFKSETGLTPSEYFSHLQRKINGLKR